MHELSLVENLIEIVTQQAALSAFTRVRKITLEVGMFSHVDVEALRFCFEVATKSTLAEGAELRVEQTPAQGVCLQCGHSVVMQNRYDPCDQCGAYGVQVEQGAELKLKYIEVD